MTFCDGLHKLNIFMFQTIMFYIECHFRYHQMQNNTDAPLSIRDHVPGCLWVKVIKLNVIGKVPYTDILFIACMYNRMSRMWCLLF